MKTFYTYSLSQWKDPLEVFPSLGKSASCLFYSGTPRGRYSILPVEHSLAQEYFLSDANAFAEIQTMYAEKKLEYNMNSVKEWNYPFCGGMSALFAYEYAHFFEKEIWDHEESTDPVAYCMWHDAFFIFDHVQKEVIFAGWSDSLHEFEVLKNRLLEKLENIPLDTSSHISLHTPFVPNITKAEYLQKFKICQKEIEQGNTFQINISQGFCAETQMDSFDIFIHAAQKNPAPMMCFCEWSSSNGSKYSIISCSPERLFSVDTKRRMWTQPIAGTRKRGKTEKQDAQLADELLASKKERAEHSMIVDLLRNDFGKIAEFGSVQVAEFARVEKYETVMHLVSDIEGILPENKTAFDVFAALFPGGTITGTPKRETMKILSENEEALRGFYCGSMAYFSLDGQCDSNICIRTLEKKDMKLSGRAGGGIVYGADGESEYKETLSKWEGMKKIFK